MNATKNLDKLKQAWIANKEAERIAVENRRKIEEDICALLPIVKGTNRFESLPGIKIAVSEVKEWDQDKLFTLAKELVIPFKLEYKPDAKKIDEVKTYQPDLWKKLLPALTLKFAKPSFSFDDKKS